ncbi:MAG: hypothetical protein R3B96_07755 [Pirellulaceae bacterium]
MRAENAGMGDRDRFPGDRACLTMGVPGSCRAEARIDRREARVSFVDQAGDFQWA